MEDRNIAERLVGLFPGAPYMAFGVCLGWTSLIFSGRFWASDVTTAGLAIFNLFSVMAASGVLILLLVGLLSRVRVQFESLSPVIGAVLCLAGAVPVLLAGPYFQQWLGIHTETIVAALFMGGGLIMGLGSTWLLLCCGKLYGQLAPQNALCYTALSYMLGVCVYFVGIAGPTAAPFPGGPTWYSMALLVGLPFLAAWLLCTARFAAVQPPEPASCGIPPKPLVAKPLVLLFILSTIVTYVHFQAVTARPSVETIEVNSYIMLMRMGVSACMLLLLLNKSNHRRNLGDIYTKCVVVLAILMAAIPLAGDIGWAGDLLTGFLLTLYEIAVWCMLAFVAHQKRIEPLRVYGVGYGLFMLGELAGCLLVLLVAPAVHAAGVATAFFMVLVAAALLAALIGFSGSDLMELTSSAEDEKPLSDALAAEISTAARPALGGVRAFDAAVSELTQRAGLSARESEVLALLAKGLSNDRVAEELFISRNTVRTHAQNLYAKLNVHSRQELMSVVNDCVQAKKA